MKSMNENSALEGSQGNGGRWLESGRASQLLGPGFAAALLLRLFYPFIDSPLDHVFSDPQRHWNNGQHFFNPGFSGGLDPIGYQLWMFLVQRAGDYNPVFILIITGLLCALQPFGWYLALKELIPRNWALAGGIIIALIPSFAVTYAFFMTETLVMSVMGLAFWATIRAWKSGTLLGFSAAALLWLVASFTRVQVIPMAGLALFSIWILGPRKAMKACVGLSMLWYIGLAAGLHTKSVFNFFSPFGNLYLNQIYGESGKEKIIIDVSPDMGRRFFVSPSYVKPTFYPFSDWRTGRDGEVSVKINTANGRADWIAERDRVARERTYPAWKMSLENLAYLSFGLTWPDNSPARPIGAVSHWMRWMWLPLYLAVAFGALRRQFRGIEWLLPASALGTFLFLALQPVGVMEARYRKPVDPIVVAALVVMAFRSRATGGKDRVNRPEAVTQATEGQAA